MQNFAIITDETGRELVDHGDHLFPLAGYDEYFSKFVLKEVSWHWHEEIEFVIVLEGSTKVEYVGGYSDLKEGEGLFINSNILHRLTQIGDIDCHILNFVFKSELLGGRYDSRIYTEYIQPICSNRSLSAITFSPNVSWQNEILEKIKEAFTAYALKTFGFELSITSALLEAWRILILERSDLFTDILPQTESKRRIHRIISYIHKHYSQKLSVHTLSMVAGISESECYRLFQKTLKITPTDYILNHRLQLGALRLVESDTSILQLTYELGFGSPSYFSKKFKEQYHMTPREFRQQYQLQSLTKT